MIPAEAKESLIRRRIVLTAGGSFGDVHPFIAVALGLKARGHEPILATGQSYRQKVEALGLPFRAVRPDFFFVSDSQAMQRIMDLRWGSIRVIRELILPVLRDSYEGTLAAAEGADLLVSHPLCYATLLVAENTGIPWASTMITPLGLYSAYDPPMLPIFPYLSKRLRFLGPAFWKPLGQFLKWATRSWAKPLNRLRAEVGLPPAEGNPLVDGHSPLLHLALFSKWLADKQPDWPPQTILTGFPLYDGGNKLPPELVDFLDSGPPPIVFTLGISAAMVAGPFYEHSVAAAKLLERRAVLILGNNPQNRPASLPDGMVAFDYAPFSELFPRAAVIVHAGGIGTTGLAMRSGRPMLVVPFAHDQPDNAQRLARLGVARTIPRSRYTAGRAVEELRRLLEDTTYANRASKVGQQVRSEDGVEAACDAIEAALKRPNRETVDR